MPDGVLDRVNRPLDDEVERLERGGVRAVYVAEDELVPATTRVADGVTTRGYQTRLARVGTICGPGCPVETPMQLEVTTFSTGLA